MQSLARRPTLQPPTRAAASTTITAMEHIDAAAKISSAPALSIVPPPLPHAHTTLRAPADVTRDVHQFVWFCLRVDRLARVRILSCGRNQLRLLRPERDHLQLGPGWSWHTHS